MSAPTDTFTSVRASHILVDTEAEAMNLKSTIESGDQTFEQAASAVSKCPSGAKGGDLGFFERGMMVKPFENAAFDGSMELNQVSEPVKTDFGFHLIKVTERK
jgi:peptidyl-prolyl cis-trans isomerase C